MFRTILVPLDGSPFAEHALPTAAAVAKRTGARIRFVHVFVPAPPPMPAELPSDFVARQQAEARDRITDYLERLARRLDDVVEEPIAYDVFSGAVVDGIHEVAAGQGADLIVMTTHGRGGFARAWLGSAADAVVRAAGVPVLLARPGEGVVDFSRAVRLAHVLVPLDGSQLAEEVLAPAAAIAGKDGQITLVGVAKASHAQPVSAPHGAILEPIGTANDARDYLTKVAALVSAGGGAKVDVTVVAHESAAVAILEVAADVGADVIAIATRGRSGIARLMLGSTADKVIRGAPVPVLAWRPQS